MKEKLLMGLLALTIGCKENVCDTENPIINEIYYNVEHTTLSNYDVTVAAPETIYGMYLITKNHDCKADQVDCSYGNEYMVCTWHLDNDHPIGVRLYDSCHDPFEIKFN
ncbi:hypothetical protein HN385_02230 [archaeon]|jgi:hypothetical protein|nr:hypothetical protein [archaeon]MBT3450372.1 hypothetical protein [archaeon]MBT6868853.1 hypothetical protein [archaeon]MBT7192926.1 hypothetical protein [archaeon]MBT7380892.1 hypothetical protein [archaeon]